MTQEVLQADESSAKKFVHLHLHTEYSLLDGASKISKLVEEVKKQGSGAVAITDHGNMFGAIKFYNACVKAGIKPIIGCEFYVTNDLKNKKSSKIADSEEDESNPKYHLVLLAKDLTGYRNLSKLCSIAYLDGFYGKPRIDLEVLEKHSEGLVCLSACIGGAIPRLLLSKTSMDPYGDALAYAKKLKSLFDEGDFYIELQDHGIDDEKRVMPALIRIANEIGVKCVATNDVHYIHKSDDKMHDVLLCIQTASDYDDPNRMRFFGSEFYLKTYDEMLELFPNFPEALDTTAEIADKCNLKIPFGEYSIPVYGANKGIEPNQYLRDKCYEGLKVRYKVLTDEIIQRAEYELGIIIRMGFASYYLIVWDFIDHAKSKGIPVGAGRGSGVGSIVAYAIGITDVDPIKYGLIFERFLNPERVTMPDFDVDFCGDRRDEVIEYVRNEYGSEKVAQIITFGTMKSKQAIKDVARVYKLPFAEVNLLLKNVKIMDKSVKISHLIDEKSEHKVKELAELYKSNPIYKEVLDIAMQIEDMPRNRGKHAAGVIICDVPLIEKVPLAKNGEDITTQFDMVECESLGLLKMDFLALKTLTDVKMTTNYVEKIYGKNINFSELGYEDPNVYALIAGGNTETVFQLESAGMQDFMQKLKPSLMEEIIAGISLFRPGPLDKIPDYIKNKMNIEKVDFRDERLKPILQDTYGIIVYQEQAMKITQVLAGYSMPDADKFRKFISKKENAPEQIKKEKNKFVTGCLKNNVPQSLAEELWSELEAFGKYAFNKSHAAAYAVLAYQTAYMKAYYKVEYMCSVINNRLGNANDTTKYLRLIKSMNINLLPPDINHSHALFYPQDGQIRYGLACIKNVGRQAINQVVKEREENGPFKDFSDFARRIPQNILSKRMLESLIKGGAFDCFGHTRRTLLANYETILAREASNNELLSSGQIFMDFMLDEEYTYQEIPETKKERLMYEREVAGRYITGHPLDGREDEFRQFSFNLSMIAPIHKGDSDDEEDDEVAYSFDSGTNVYLGGIINNIERKVSKSNKRWASAILEDMYDSIELTIFQGVLDKYSSLLIEDNLVKIRGIITYSPTSPPRIDVKEIYPLELKEEDKLVTFDKRKLCLKMDGECQDTLCKIENILRSREGANEILVQMNKCVYKFDYTTGDLDGIKDDLVCILGQRNVKIID